MMKISKETLDALLHTGSFSGGNNALSLQITIRVWIYFHIFFVNIYMAIP
jgi:hypothetical protein